MRPFRKFLINPVLELAKYGKLAGMLLIIATLISFLLSNSAAASVYLGFWDTQFAFAGEQHSIVFWVNEGLMPFFFLLVGIEIRRELVRGELSSPSQAVLPVFAALGGILVPAVIFFLFNHNDPGTVHGWAIPTATDIAFSLGILSFLGNRVPFFLKVFLTALAIIDDLAAILIIAIFYSVNLAVWMILASAAVLVLTLALSRLKIKLILVYILSGILLWYFILRSGINPTIAGVALAFIIPEHIAETLERKLSVPVYYFILPLFALANTAIPLSLDLTGKFASPVSLGIILGLFVGKPAGIVLLTFILVKLKISSIPAEVNRGMIAGMGMLAGIGFTMSIFIATLSFDSAILTNIAKLAIIGGSLLSGVLGLLVLSFSLKRKVIP